MDTLTHSPVPRVRDLEPVLEAHRQWVAREPGGVQADLRQHVLHGADLSGRMLAEAILRDVDLTQANLAGTCLERADLRFASLRGADLRGADLRGACLDCTALDGANLGGADFEGASLKAASLEDVLMSWFDHTLLSERLWRAAGDQVELQMVAAFIGRTKSRCWDDYRNLTPRHRNWVLSEFARWRRPGDEAPELLEVWGRRAARTARRQG